MCVCTAMSLQSSQAFPRRPTRLSRRRGRDCARKGEGEGEGGGGERPAGRSAGPLAPTAGPAGRRGVSSASERWPRPTSLPTWLRTPPTLTPEEREQKGRVVKCILSGFSETGRATVFQKVKTSFQVRLMKLKEPSWEWHTGRLPVVLPPGLSSKSPGRAGCSVDTSGLTDGLTWFPDLTKNPYPPRQKQTHHKENLRFFAPKYWCTVQKLKIS